LQEAVNRRLTYSTIAKRRRTKRRTMIYKVLHRKLMIVQHKPP